MKIICDSDKVCLELTGQEAEDIHAAVAFLSMEIQDPAMRQRLLALLEQLGRALPHPPLKAP